MSRELSVFGFFEGTRNSTQVLYHNHLFNRHSGGAITWRSLRSPITQNSLFN